MLTLLPSAILLASIVSHYLVSDANALPEPRTKSVIPLKAGILKIKNIFKEWILSFAGMTGVLGLK